MRHVSQNKAGKNYEQRLSDYIDGHPVCDDKVAADLGRICRTRLVSAQVVLEVLEVVECGHRRLDEGMKGMPWDYSQLDGAAEIDQIFYPANSIELE